MSTGRMLLKEIYVGFLLLLLSFLYLSQLTKDAHQLQHDISRSDGLKHEFLKAGVMEKEIAANG